MAWEIGERTAGAIFWKTWFTKETVSRMISKPWACNPDWKVRENSKHHLLKVLDYRNLGKNPSNPNLSKSEKQGVSNVSVACRGWFLRGAVVGPLRLRGPTRGPLKKCREYPPSLGGAQSRSFVGFGQKKRSINFVGPEILFQLPGRMKNWFWLANPIDFCQPL